MSIWAYAIRWAPPGSWPPGNVATIWLLVTSRSPGQVATLTLPAIAFASSTGTSSPPSMTQIDTAPTPVD